MGRVGIHRHDRVRDKRGVSSQRCARISASDLALSTDANVISTLQRFFISAISAYFIYGWTLSVSHAWFHFRHWGVWEDGQRKAIPVQLMRDVIHSPQWSAAPSSHPQQQQAIQVRGVWPRVHVVRQLSKARAFTHGRQHQSTREFALFCDVYVPSTWTSERSFHQGWGEVQVPIVRQGFYTPQWLEDPHTHAHWRKAIRVRSLLFCVHHVTCSQNARALAHWRETVQMWGMRARFHEKRWDAYSYVHP